MAPPLALLPWARSKQPPPGQHRSLLVPAHRRSHTGRGGATLRRPTGAFARPHFLHQWLHHPAGTVHALLDREGLCHGFGRIRPCLLKEGDGWRIGPLVADHPAAAKALVEGLLQRHDGPVLNDGPGANPQVGPVLEALGFQPIAQTLRMYRGPAPQLTLADVYGLACLELG